VRQAFEHGRHRLADHVDHHQPVNRLASSGMIRIGLSASRLLGAPNGRWPWRCNRRETGDDAADETGAQGAGQQAADHPGARPGRSAMDQAM
jgi:hypothetical protein